MAPPLMLDEQIRRNKAATVRLFVVVFLILAAMVSLVDRSHRGQTLEARRDAAVLFARPGDWVVGSAPQHQGPSLHGSAAKGGP